MPSSARKHNFVDLSTGEFQATEFSGTRADEALCDKLEQPGTGKKLVRREVVRFITPGTATDIFVLVRREPNSPLFPYPTLFRSDVVGAGHHRRPAVRVLAAVGPLRRPGRDPVRP